MLTRDGVALVGRLVVVREHPLVEVFTALPERVLHRLAGSGHEAVERDGHVARREGHGLQTASGTRTHRVRAPSPTTPRRRSVPEPAATGDRDGDRAVCHTNGDDAFFAWSAPTTDDWLGFALYREVYRADGTVLQAGYLRNYVGFESDEPEPGESRPSTVWPIQRYTWTDHGVETGTAVTYWIAPVAVVDGFLEVVEDEEVGYGPVDVSTGSPSGHAYFNRGFVLSQFIARSLPAGYEGMSWAQKRTALKNFKEDLATSDSNAGTSSPASSVTPWSTCSRG